MQQLICDILKVVRTTQTILATVLYTWDRDISTLMHIAWEMESRD